MRTAFIKTLEAYATPETVLITGDLGFGVLTDFSKKYPKQFINAGVAEQNMTGMATGLAMCGKKVFTYSIANFNTLRAIEFIRNDIAYHNLNVTVVSVGGGLAYGQLGISHHATEDLAILRAIPNLKVFAPGDTEEAREITRRIIQQDLGPVYLRLGRAGEATLHSPEQCSKLEIGKLHHSYKSNSNTLAFISTGGMLEVAYQVKEELKNVQGVDASIYSAHTIKPFDKSGVLNILRTYNRVCTFEEHSIAGGLASCVMESVIGEKGIDPSIIYAFALPSEFTSIVGDQAYLRNEYGISKEKIIKTINQWQN